MEKVWALLFLGWSYNLELFKYLQWKGITIINRNIEFFINFWRDINIML